jgi:2-polyprenyl-6-methoxyphenol hydroxylase-like FAD-dependent oxidoreductase
VASLSTGVDYVTMQTVVIGAGPAGCAAALALSRRSHDVALIDRDENPELFSATADQIFDTWDRPTVGQFRQPHNLLGRGRAVLRDEFPDVYEALLMHGAGEIRQDTFLGDAVREPGDDDLATIACRRPVIDAVLRSAVAAQHGVTFHNSAVHGLRIAHGTHVTGVELAPGETIDADLVVDASGRNSSASRWLADRGAVSWRERTCDSKLLYYSRHYRFRGEPPPYASILGGPRGDLGYLAYAVFIGDNRTFCLCIMTPSWEKDWRVVREPAAFERVARELPGMPSWLEAAEPISSVLPMGQLRNTLRETSVHGAPLVTGLVPIGDARVHTNPTFAFGLSLSLGHASALADAADAAGDDVELATAFDQSVGADAAQRYHAVSNEDRDRLRLWSGEPINPADRADTMPLFLRSVVYRVATQDPAVLRAVCRRINLLDPIDALADNEELLDRAETLSKGLPPNGAPPPRTTMLAALRDTAR